MGADEVRYRSDRAATEPSSFRENENERTNSIAKGKHDELVSRALSVCGCQSVSYTQCCE